MPEAALRKPGALLGGNTDTSFLKILALLAMLTDHMGVVIFPNIMELRVIGRMALPLYAWCLVVGGVKTHDPVRYCLRLLVLALLSQPLYMMALNHQWTDFSILFLLLIGQIAIQGIRIRFCLSQIWVPALCYVLLGFLKIDYGWRGLTFILFLYGARQSKSAIIGVYLAYALFWGASSSSVTSLFGYPLAFLQWPGIGEVLSAFFRLQSMVWLSLPLIVLPTNTQIHMPKWLGYGLYPLHLVVLIILRLCMTDTTLAMMLSRF
ncbi:MAG: TraX family protein [Eubacteriales bacterium]|nr:TraX family protein [Eubacteriales bacterium]